MEGSDVAKQKIQETCLAVMASKKARFSEKIAAAQLLAGVNGLYGPGRPRVVSAHAPKSVEEPPKINNANTPGERLRRILERAITE
jgi:hypothetical protein